MTDPSVHRPKRLPTNTAKVYDLGFRTGEQVAAKEVTDRALSFLQRMYMDDPRPDRDSPEAEAILKVAKELSAHLRGDE